MRKPATFIAATFIATTLIATASFAVAQTKAPASVPDLTGVYQIVSSKAVIAGGLKNIGAPSEISLLPAAKEQVKTINVKDDPGRQCQPVGPFRMMAREGNKIELIPTTTGTVVMLFEDLSRGVMRTIYMNRGHRTDLGPLWMGDSVGKWEGDTLVVDTNSFNTETWLNEAGAQHSEALHLIERIRPISGGKYLEYKVTAEDSKSLAKPYTYTRYYERSATEIAQDNCVEDGE
jgi:hypothetical protein